VLVRGVVGDLERRRGDGRVVLGEGSEILVLVCVGLQVDEAKNSPDSLGIEQKRDGCLKVHGQSAVQARRDKMGGSTCASRQWVLMKSSNSQPASCLSSEAMWKTMRWKGMMKPSEVIR
jgi:hypothetical protein